VEWFRVKGQLSNNSENRASELKDLGFGEKVAQSAQQGNWVE